METDDPLWQLTAEGAEKDIETLSKTRLDTRISGLISILPPISLDFS